NNMPKWFLILLTIVTGFFLVFTEERLDTSPTPEQPTNTPQKQTANVVKVIDGDTIRVVVDGEEFPVRLIGIDSPETVDPNRPNQCFGVEASNYLKNLLLDKSVELEADVSTTDRYGRLLRYVWLNGVLVNEQIVGEGYGYASAYPPDVKYQERLDNAQSQA